MREEIVDMLVGQAVSEEKMLSRLRATIAWPIALTVFVLAASALMSRYAVLKAASIYHNFGDTAPRFAHLFSLLSNPWIVPIGFISAQLAVAGLYFAILWYNAKKHLRLGGRAADEIDLLQEHFNQGLFLIAVLGSGLVGAACFIPLYVAIQHVK